MSEKMTIEPSNQNLTVTGAKNLSVEGTVTAAGFKTTAGTAIIVPPIAKEGTWKESKKNYFIFDDDGTLVGVVDKKALDRIDFV